MVMTVWENSASGTHLVASKAWAYSVLRATTEEAWRQLRCCLPMPMRAAAQWRIPPRTHFHARRLVLAPLLAGLLIEDDIPGDVDEGREAGS